MKVRQFLNKFLCGSSSIDLIFVEKAGRKTRLIGCMADPMARDTAFEAELNSTLISFRIVKNEITIYAK